MQTFLVHKDFPAAAAMLDSRRLNKQVLESYQILRVLSNLTPSGAWRNHPAVKMWRGHESVLFTYTIAMLREAEARGIKVDTHRSNLSLLRNVASKTWGFSLPDWYRNPKTLSRLITTHKANLYKKDPEYYYKFSSFVDDMGNRPCCDTCKYYWPTHASERTLV